MSKERQRILIIIYYLVLVVIGGRLIFFIPNGKYLGILNTDNFFTISCTIVLLSMLLIYFLLKSSPIKKMLINMVVTIVIFIVVGVYYYSNLPKYTYEEAAQKVEEVEKESGKNSKVYIPEHREDKIAYSSGSFFKTTNDKYFIYLKNGNEIFIYRFDPLNGEYEIYQGTRKLLE